jgi:hypothetical protein
MTKKKIVTRTGAGATLTSKEDYHAFESKEMWINATNVMQVKTKNFHVFADDQILLKAGGSTIEITPGGVTIHSTSIKLDGKVTDIDGVVVSINGTTSVDIHSDGHVTAEGGTVDVKGSPINIQSSGTVDVQGNPILLNC